MRKQSILLWLVLFSMLFIASCHKLDSEITEAEKPASIERFFNLPANADSRLKAIAQSIRMQEKEHPFLEKFIKTAGWPRWDKSKIIGPQNRNNGRLNEDSSSLVYIPFVIDTVHTVKVVLAVNMEADDTAWQTLYANNYADFGFDSASSNNWNARDVFQFFAMFDHDIFGHTKFKLKDSMLFNTPRNSIITLKSIDGVPVNGRTNRVISYVDVCSTWEVCDNPHGPTDPPDDPPDQARIASCYYTMNCVTYYYFDWSSGGGGGSGNGSGGGGGSGGSWWSSPTCTNTATGTPIACPPGWVPIVMPEITEIDVSGIVDPCLLAVIATVGTPGHSSFILKTYDQQQYTPSTTHRYKIKYENDNSLTGSDGLPIPGRTNLNVLPDGTNEVVIKLNTSMFQGASKEWVISVMLHEMMHGILLVNRPTMTDQEQIHEYMFDNRVPITIFQSLKELFPTMNDYDALALGMGGFNDGILMVNPNNPGGPKIPKPGKDQFAQENYFLSILQAREIQNNYINGVLGTPYC